LLNQTPQGRAHYFFKVRGRKARAAELQLRNNAPEEDAALLYR